MIVQVKSHPKELFIGDHISVVFFKHSLPVVVYKVDIITMNRMKYVHQLLCGGNLIMPNYRMLSRVSLIIIVSFLLLSWNRSLPTIPTWNLLLQREITHMYHHP